LPYLDTAPTPSIPLASWHGMKGRNRGCGRTRSGDCHSLSIGTDVLSSGLLLSFKLFENQMDGEIAARGKSTCFLRLELAFSLRRQGCPRNSSKPKPEK